MQAVVLVSVFRKASRQRIMQWLEWCLPHRLPVLWKGQPANVSPASLLHSFVEQRIKSFQAGVALRQSAVHPSQKWVLAQILLTCGCCAVLHIPPLVGIQFLWEACLGSCFLKCISWDDMRNKVLPVVLRVVALKKGAKTEKARLLSCNLVHVQAAGVSSLLWPPWGAIL